MNSNRAYPQLPVVIRCPESIQTFVQYVFDTLFMACGSRWNTPTFPRRRGRGFSMPLEGALTAGRSMHRDRASAGGVAPVRWRLGRQVAGAANGLAAVFPADRFCVRRGGPTFHSTSSPTPSTSSRPGRNAKVRTGRARDSSMGPRSSRDSASRRTSWTAIWSGLGQPLLRWATVLARRTNARLVWPSDAHFAVALSHDVDFLPSGLFDNVLQGGKTLLRHLLRQRDPADALRAGTGLVKSLLGGARSLWLRAGDHRGGDTTWRSVVLSGRSRPPPSRRRQLRHP